MENFLVKIVRYFWRAESREEAIKFLGLSIAGFFLIGANWPVKIGKDCLLLTELGAGHQPIIKALSILVCFPVMLLYSYLVSFFSSEAVLYSISLVFAGIGAILAISLRYAAALAPEYMGFLVNAFYIYAECLSSVSIAPFWAFVNNVSKPEEAKRNYGMIVCFAQVGGLSATLLARKISSYYLYCSTTEVFVYKTAAPAVAMATAILLVMFAVSIYFTVNSIKKSSLEGYVPRHIKPKIEITGIGSVVKDFVSGFSIILSSSYVFGLFLLTSFQEILGTLMHFSVLKSAQNTFALKSLRSAFVEDYELMVQIIAVIFSIRATSWVQQRLGIRMSLLFYPTVLFFVFGFVITWKTAWPVAIAVAIAKGLYYSFSKPVREILYIPTSKTIRFRSKAWIDIFGARAAKLSGSLLSKTLGYFGQAFAPVFLFLPVIWIFVAKGVGNIYHENVVHGTTIGDCQEVDINGKCKE